MKKLHPFKILCILAVAFVTTLVIIDNTGSVQADNSNTARVQESHRYLVSMWMTPWQADYVIMKSDQARDPSHFVGWFGAIMRHENGWKFTNWSTKHLAWRLKAGMEYKPFTTQLDWRLGAYNKYRYQHSTTYWRLSLSRYCVSDTHGWGAWCPNRQRNVPHFIAQYQYYNYWGESVQAVEQNINRYKNAVQEQEKLHKQEAVALKAWATCKIKWFCTK